MAVILASSLSWAQANPNAVQVNGYIDAYYSHNFTNSGRGITLNGRSFDIRNDELDLALAEIDFTKPAKADDLGFTAWFYGGKGPDLIHLAEPGGKNKYKWIRQAYVTYVTPQKNALTIDFGKYDTWVGYEAIDTRYQDQYSRSFDATYSGPTYATGLRLTQAFNSKLTGSFYLFQGWNEVEDANHGKSWAIGLVYTPDSTTTYWLENHSGEEGSNHANDAGLFGGIGFVHPGTSHVDLFNLSVSKQITPKSKIGLNADYTRSSTAPNNGTWNGEDLYYRTQFSANRAASLRLDRFEDRTGVRVGVPVKLYSVTTGYDRTFTPNFTLRFELRHDLSDRQFFLGRNGNLDKSRTTFTVGAIAKF